MEKVIERIVNVAKNLTKKEVRKEMKKLIRKVVEVVGVAKKSNQDGGKLVMKKLASLAVGLFLVAGFATVSSAYNSQGSSATITIQCSIDAQLSVDVETATFTIVNLGNLETSSSAVITSSITVENDSGGLTESYMLSATNASESDGGSDVWTLADTPGADTFAIRAAFGYGASAPNNDDTDFTVANHKLTTIAVIATASMFFGTETGENVLFSAPIRPLWLRILTPDSVTNAESHETVVTITAVTPL